MLVGVAFSQNKASHESITAEIRMLERAQVKAVLESDEKSLNDLLLPDYTINAPLNRVTKKEEMLQRLREGFIRYSSFESEIEAIVIHGDTVITMGRETVKPIGKAPMAGQTVLRRYTHVWLKENGRWRQIARHASVVGTGSR